MDGPVGRYGAQAIAATPQGSIAVPNGFNSQFERFQFLLPGPHQFLPYETGARAMARRTGAPPPPTPAQELQQLLATHDGRGVDPVRQRADRTALSAGLPRAGRALAAHQPAPARRSPAGQPLAPAAVAVPARMAAGARSALGPPRKTQRCNQSACSSSHNQGSIKRIPDIAAGQAQQHVQANSTATSNTRQGADDAPRQQPGQQAPAATSTPNVSGRKTQAYRLTGQSAKVSSSSTQPSSTGPASSAAAPRSGARPASRG